MKAEFDAFLTFAHKFCHERGIALSLPKSRTVRTPDGEECAGYFLGDKVVVAWLGPLNARLTTLVHELCHVEQYWQSAAVWREFEGTKGAANWYDADAPLTEEERRAAMLATLRLELDCERRVLRWIKRHSLPVSPETYASQAALYMYSHHLLLERLRWFKRGSKLIKAWREVNKKHPHLLPTNLRGSFKRVPKEIHAALSKLF